MGRFVSRLESIPIYLFDLTATISSSRPKKRLALDGREHSGRARFNVANYDDTEGSSPSGASIAPQCRGRLRCVPDTTGLARCPSDAEDESRRAGSSRGAHEHCQLWQALARVACCRSRLVHLLDPHTARRPCDHAARARTPPARHRSTLRCLQCLQLPGRLSQVRLEAANAEPGEISFHSVDEAGDLPHKVLALTARSPCVLVCDCGHRSHAAVLWFTAQPAEKSALKELGVESIGLRPSMFARYRNARRMDHIRFDLMGAQPARQPEAIAASLIGDGDPLDDVAGLIGFLPPTMQKLQQCILIGRELFQRLSFNSRHNTGDQPT